MYDHDIQSIAMLQITHLHSDQCCCGTRLCLPHAVNLRFYYFLFLLLCALPRTTDLFSSFTSPYRVFINATLQDVHDAILSATLAPCRLRWLTCSPMEAQIFSPVDFGLIVLPTLRRLPLNCGLRFHTMPRSMSHSG